MKMNRQQRTLLSALAIAGVTGFPVASGSLVAAEPLASLQNRTTDETIARDLARIETLRSQIASSASADPWRKAKAEAFLVVARQEYLENDRTGFDVAAFTEAETLAGAMAGGTEAVTSSTVPKGGAIAGSTLVRRDLWDSLELLKRDKDFSCAATVLARAEVELLWAGNEQIDQGDCRVTPHVAEAERLLLEARRLEAACSPAPAVAVAPEPHAETAPVVKRAPEASVAPGTMELNIPRNVHFALGKYSLSATSRSVIAGVVEILQKYPSLTVRLEGHTDSRASAAFNLALSKKRAEAVRAEMMQLGIAPERIATSFLGKSSLKAAEDSKANFARNRRVEMIFVSAEGLIIHAADQEADLQPEGADQGH